MLGTELSTGKGSTYLEPHTKLAQPFNPSDLWKEWVIDWLDESGYGEKARQILTCGTNVVKLECPNGHQKRVRIVCHKEYCTKCGNEDSLLHKRTKARALDRLMWCDVLGYMVFTLPREVSDAMPSKEQLCSIEKEVSKIISDNFSAPGCMVRTHLMGKEIGHLHIHVNVLFPIVGTNYKGKVPQTTLDNARQRWTMFVNKTFNLDLDTTDVHYNFATSIRRKRHRIKYVTRPVVTATKFLTLSSEIRHWYMTLRGWHNTRWYGQLANCKYKEYLKSIEVTYLDHREEEVALAKKCPVCNERYKKQGIMGVDEIIGINFRQLDENVWVCLETFAVLKNKDSP